MIQLKDYQERVLDSLREFLRLCARDGRPGTAFQRVTERNGTAGVPYMAVNAAGLDPGMPYLCLRVPTGGGKTLLACHATGSAIREFLRAERAVVLWLVPSNAILDQTADALRNPRHPYRRALDVACGAVEVVTIEEALRLPCATVEGQTVVIVATIQSFRVEDTTGRKVYEQNGAFSEHFLNVPSDRLANLLPGADGRPKPSLVNMLRMRRPVVILDEAHNARTKLSFSTLGAVRPSCIIEFTATPSRAASAENPLQNVLHRVSAAELKAAEMVKLPLRVVTRHPSQRDQLLAEAITLRDDLEKLANTEGQQTGEYLRPILLVQAERVDACDAVRERLVGEHGLAKDAVRISVGGRDELKVIGDISAPSCPVRVVITVERLREGWDCPFAYVLCSLKETRSATAIEQIVGRILRLPSARLKRHPDLNCGYVFSLSPHIEEVLGELRDALESNGFTAAEASRIVIPVPQGSLPLGAQPRTIVLAPGTELDPAVAISRATELQGRVRIDAVQGSIQVLMSLSEEDTARLVSCATTAEAKARVREVVEAVRASEIAFGGTGHPRVPTPFERGENFVVPRLSMREGQALMEFESTHLVEHAWKLSEKDATLPQSYDPRIRPAGQLGRIDVAASGRVETERVAGTPENDFVATLHQQVLDVGGCGDWTVEELVAWLDAHIEHRDIPIGESAAFLGKVVRGLMARLGIADVSQLALDRFRLREFVEERIHEHRAAERGLAFKELLAPGSPLAVSEQNAINFRTMLYEPSWLYEGGFVFKHHYFPPRPGELREKTPANKPTEEFLCAQYLDDLRRISFWVRNLSRKTSSFRLQTSTDWFYPDFVCQLVDGRILVVEYKGADRYSADDAREKRQVGEVWASRSGGRCLFLMPTGKDLSSIDAAIRP